MALGANASSVARMVAGESLRLAIPGLLGGLALALAGTGVAGGMLVGVTPWDPVALGGAALFVLATTLLASYWPARRAVRVDPMVSVRSQ
jgi:ABC-type antimicrobial peptide transport system permease subunit